MFFEYMLFWFSPPNPWGNFIPTLTHMFSTWVETSNRWDMRVLFGGCFLGILQWIRGCTNMAVVGHTKWPCSCCHQTETWMFQCSPEIWNPQHEGLEDVPFHFGMIFGFYVSFLGSTWICFEGLEVIMSFKKHVPYNGIIITVKSPILGKHLFWNS